MKVYATEDPDPTADGSTGINGVTTSLPDESAWSNKFSEEVEAEAEHSGYGVLGAGGVESKGGDGNGEVGFIFMRSQAQAKQVGEKALKVSEGEKIEIYGNVVVIFSGNDQSLNEREIVANCLKEAHPIKELN